MRFLFRGFRFVSGVYAVGLGVRSPLIAKVRSWSRRRRPRTELPGISWRLAKESEPGNEPLKHIMETLALYSAASRAQYGFS